MIRIGDCVQVMAFMQPESVDAVVTDPPYALAFMGKHWDNLTPAKFQEWCMEWGKEALRVSKPGAYLLAFGGTRTHHRLVCGLEDAGWIIRDELDWVYASGFPKGKANLKPAHEPIVLARKPGPLRPLAIDACRIPSNGELAGWHKATGSTPRFGSGVAYGGEPETFDDGPVEANPAGRWPSNLLLQDPELFDTANGDTGGYSRFFIIPKAARKDREQGLNGNGQRLNVHPTVKPTDLMRHLVRLVTPEGGTVLDCFLGSGSTAIAAEMEGFDWIGIEKEAEYVKIAEARLNGIQKGLGLAI